MFYDQDPFTRRDWKAPNGTNETVIKVHTVDGHEFYAQVSQTVIEEIYRQHQRFGRMNQTWFEREYQNRRPGDATYGGGFTYPFTYTTNTGGAHNPRNDPRTPPTQPSDEETRRAWEKLNEQFKRTTAAFEDFTTKPKTGKQRIAEMAGVEWPLTITDKQLWRKAQRACHPDTGGSHELWVELDKLKPCLDLR